MNLLDIQEVSKFYATHKALDHVSLAVPEACIYGLLGPNGAGKTSLIRILNQITAPDTGRIFFKDQPLNPEHIYQIGYLPEERGLYKKQKVWDQMIYFGQLKGLSLSEAKLRSEQWLVKFDLKDWKNKKIEELSKGMQQKVQFIITVLHQPKLLILDEPFNGLDLETNKVLEIIIVSLKQKQKTVFVSSHIIDPLLTTCDKIHLLENGCFVKTYTKTDFLKIEEDLFGKLKTEATQFISKAV